MHATFLPWIGPRPVQFDPVSGLPDPVLGSCLFPYSVFDPDQSGLVLDRIAPLYFGVQFAHSDTHKWHEDLKTTWYRDHTISFFQGLA